MYISVLDRYMTPDLRPQISTNPPGQLLNRDYHLMARSHGFSSERNRDQDINVFPIEEARLRSTLYPLLLCSSATAAYGWTLHMHVVSEFMSGAEKINLRFLAYLRSLNSTIHHRS
jgi:hypothetical protein